MAEVWIVNASPLIVLAQVGALDLLTQLANEIIVPDAVVAEVCAGPSGDPARLAVEQGWGTRVAPIEVPISVIEWSLGAGESAVLSIAIGRMGCTAVLDDAEARACARAHGIPLLGTLGIVLRAKQQGVVPSAVQLIRDLRQVDADRPSAGSVALPAARAAHDSPRRGTRWSPPDGAGASQPA